MKAKQMLADLKIAREVLIQITEDRIEDTTFMQEDIVVAETALVALEAFVRSAIDPRFINDI